MCILHAGYLRLQTPYQSYVTLIATTVAQTHLNVTFYVHACLVILVKSYNLTATYA